MPKSVMNEDPSTFAMDEGESNPYLAKGGKDEGSKSFATVKR
jgi:hypothetical protein